MREIVLTRWEQYSLKRLEKYEREWTSWRWFFIAAAVTLSLCGFYILNVTTRMALLTNEVNAITIIWVVPAAWFMFAMGSVLLGHSIVNWKGNIRARLMLKMARALGQETVE